MIKMNNKNHQRCRRNININEQCSNTNNNKLNTSSNTESMEVFLLNILWFCLNVCTLKCFSPDSIHIMQACYLNQDKSTNGKKFLVNWTNDYYILSFGFLHKSPRLHVSDIRWDARWFDRTKWASFCFQVK